MDAEELDVCYGIVGRRKGSSVRFLEKKFRPNSYCVLGESSGGLISDLKQLASLSTVSVLTESVRLIWAVSRNGQVHLAFEELVDPNKGQLGQVFHPGMNLKPRIDKLGHPALVNDTEARISGELYLDDGAWVINNKSGRFGFLADRCEQHLANVAAEFAKQGLEVEVDFLPPE